MNRALALLVSVVSLVSGATDVSAGENGPLMKQSFEALDARGTAEEGVLGRAAVLGPEAVLPAMALSTDLNSDWTVSLWFRVNAWPDHGSGIWNRKSPMTVISLTEAKDPALVVRLHRERVQLAWRVGDRWHSIDGSYPVVPGQWHHLAVVRGDRVLAWYLDGRSDGFRFIRVWPEYAGVQLGRFGNTRHLQGRIDELSVYRRALNEREIQKLIAAVPDERVNDNLVESPVGDVESLVPLRVIESGVHPLIDGLHVSAAVVPWYGPDRADLLISGQPKRFGSSVKLHRQLDDRDRRSMPVYHSGVQLDQIRGEEFQALVRPDGRFDLLAFGHGTMFGREGVIIYPNRGEAGSPSFATPKPLTIGGRLMADAVRSQISGWHVGDLDHDGVPDLILAVHDARWSERYWPDHVTPWKGVETPNQGRDRGYDVQGKWLGLPLRTRLLWAKGIGDVDDVPAFAELKPIHHRVKGFAAQWQSYETERAMAVLRIEKQTWLLHTGSIDRLLALPIRVADGEAICDDGVPVTPSGTTQGTYYVKRINVIDLDQDGESEIVLDGNPGRVVVLKGRRIGEFQELGSLNTVGGDVAVDTLAVPCRVDWDGDGFSDLIIGDSSGFLTFWAGTTDPMRYMPGQYFHVDGARVHHQAGPTGSIQGPNEARWGYLNPVVCDWDADGELDIITNDIQGHLMLYRRTGEDTALSPPMRFKHDGEHVNAAWRTRPAVVSGSMGFRDDRLPCLVFIDWDGDLAVGVPERLGSTRLQTVTKLTDESDSPIRLCGPSGFWGRTKLAVVDWDEDGRWDVLFGTNGSSQRTFLGKDAPRGATPYLLRNIGTPESPRFDRPRVIRFASSRPLDFGVHNASVWPTDIDGDSRSDLIIGAEDGKTYGVLRDALSW